MGLAHTKSFRGSAAFFALLLASASGVEAAPADIVPVDTAAPAQQGHHAQPSGAAAQAARVASKFARRRLPFGRPSQGATGEGSALTA
jgi:hypothetical protein